MKQVYLLIERIRTEMNAKLIIHSSLVFIDVDEKKSYNEGDVVMACDPAILESLHS
jgi:hypothetical protein